MQMLREQTGHHLDAWLDEAEASHLPEFQSEASGIHHDKAAVLAGLTLPWSTGLLEGHVNRLKLLKRSMYGRAKLPRLASACASCGGISEACSHRPACCRVRGLTRAWKKLKTGEQQHGCDVDPTHDEAKEGGH